MTKEDFILQKKLIDDIEQLLSIIKIHFTETNNISITYDNEFKKILILIKTKLPHKEAFNQIVNIRKNWARTKDIDFIKNISLNIESTNGQT